MLFRLCVGYLFTPWEHPDLQKKKQYCTNSVFLFLSSFSIVTVLEHLDMTVLTSARGPTPTGSSFPHPRLFPPSRHWEVTFHEKQESYQHVSMLPGQFAICLCSQRWVTSAFFCGLVRKQRAELNGFFSPVLCPTGRRELSLSCVGDTSAWLGGKTGGRWWEMEQSPGPPTANLFSWEGCKIGPWKTTKSHTVSESWQRKGKTSSCHGWSPSGGKDYKLRLCLENNLVLPCFSAS